MPSDILVDHSDFSRTNIERRTYFPSIPKPPLPPNETLIRWITEAEEAQLETVLPPKTWKLVKLAIETGCRRGELMDMEPGQINGNRLHLWKTKTDSPRTIPMSEATVQLATDLAGGEMPTANMLRRHWEAARIKLGLQDDDLFVFHTTRHTCATRLVDAGVNPFVIQEWMGHKNMETTLRYAHVRPENLDAALAKVDLFRTAANSNAQTSAGLEGGPPTIMSGPNKGYQASW